jgi:hypothetical protein
MLSPYKIDRAGAPLPSYEVKASPPKGSRVLIAPLLDY